MTDDIVGIYSNVVNMILIIRFVFQRTSFHIPSDLRGGILLVQLSWITYMSGCGQCGPGHFM